MKILNKEIIVRATVEGLEGYLCEKVYPIDPNNPGNTVVYTKITRYEEEFDFQSTTWHMDNIIGKMTTKQKTIQINFVLSMSAIKMYEEAKVGFTRTLIDYNNETVNLDVLCDIIHHTVYSSIQASTRTFVFVTNESEEKSAKLQYPSNTSIIINLENRMAYPPNEEEEYK
jgi:hypothetical protein